MTTKPVYAPRMGVQFKLKQQETLQRLAEESGETFQTIVRYVVDVGLSHLRTDDLPEKAREDS